MVSCIYNPKTLKLKWKSKSLLKIRLEKVEEGIRWKSKIQDSYTQTIGITDNYIRNFEFAENLTLSMSNFCKKNEASLKHKKFNSFGRANHFAGI